MSILTDNVAAAESTVLKDIISTRTPFSSIIDDKTLKAAYKQCKNQPVKCVNEILPRHPIWYTRQTGIQRLFAGLRLPNVQTKDDGDVKHYTSSTKERNGSRHTLEWAERKGNHIMVVSRQEARLLRREAFNPDYSMRHEINKRMKEVQRGILRGKHLNRVFYVIKIKDTPEEVIWYLIRKVPRNMRTFKSPLTLTEKAREQWRVEQEKYAEKQHYMWKHLTPESSKSP
ncbi:hypothetical protein CEP52_001225 [Fusarium oligoseptatum]|uniref:Uncharacterized protein n=1 Tax=Fusarium oligoseptatum TaxID=2604345 RepID=A0A428UJS7_9HYPO|nr:hypothetical protein CEP52_001225 [Fusarium oligoseptatum]